MKNFIRSIFNRNKKATDNSFTGPMSESQILDILGNAICDVGYWNWWTANLPEVVQLEFGGTQFYFPSSDNTKPPSSQLAIQFRGPKSVSFLTREESKSISQDWIDDLHNDKMEPPSFSCYEFTFIDNSLMEKIIKEAKSIKTIHEYSPTDSLFKEEKYKLVFWADYYGFAVSADEIRVLSRSGEITLDEIPSLNSQWWDYLRKYWKLKDTENALPKDLFCKVTIPLENV